MRVGILTYPMLFQRDGSLRRQLRALLAAFERAPSSTLHGAVEASLLEPLHENLDDFDLVHVFGAAGGNHALVETAAACGLPVVLTPLLGQRWRRADGLCARAAERLLAWLPGAGGQSEFGQYGQIRAALRGATLVLAQSAGERDDLAGAFQQRPSHLRLLAAGIDPLYFEADGALFRQCCPLQGEFALMAGPVAAAHGQLEVARGLREMAMPLVVLGSAAAADRAEQAYLAQLRAQPGVVLLGELAERPRLRASAFAAASLCIVRGSAASAEATGLAALAAGSPVLWDGTGGVRQAMRAGAPRDSDYALRCLDWRDGRARKAAILGLLQAPPRRERVRLLVREHSWEQVALRLGHCYADAIALQGPRQNVFVGTAGVCQLLARAAGAAGVPRA